MSIVYLTEQLQDNWDTWIQSRRHQSLFTWNLGRFSKTIIHGKSRLPELIIKSAEDSIAALSSIISKSKTDDRQLAFHLAFTIDRTSLKKDEDENYSLSNNIKESHFFSPENETDLFEEDYDDDDHLNPLPKPPTLSIGCSVRFAKDDHVEDGVLCGFDISDKASPVVFEIEFKDGRKVKPTREHIKRLKQETLSK